MIWKREGEISLPFLLFFSFHFVWFFAAALLFSIQPLEHEIHVEGGEKGEKLNFVEFANYQRFSLFLLLLKKKKETAMLLLSSLCVNEIIVNLWKSRNFPNASGILKRHSRQFWGARDNLGKEALAKQNGEQQQTIEITKLNKRGRFRHFRNVKSLQTLIHGRKFHFSLGDLRNCIRHLLIYSAWCALYGVWMSFCSLMRCDSWLRKFSDIPATWAFERVLSALLYTLPFSIDFSIKVEHERRRNEERKTTRGRRRNTSKKLNINGSAFDKSWLWMAWSFCITDALAVCRALLRILKRERKREREKIASGEMCVGRLAINFSDINFNDLRKTVREKEREREEGEKG
jgi:hypothetical protein